jgi:mono/diheme cytochrome c family protein
MMRGAARLVLCLLVAGCTRSNMDSQPKYHEYEAAGLFRNGRVLQAPPPGTVAQGDLARADEIKRKPAVTAELLARGREKFDTFCSPCHDRVGGGRGMIVQRGMPQPPSLHEPRLRQADDQHIFDVITSGFGAMYSYAARVQPRDRWAIVAYVRALQLSQHAALADIPPDEQARLAAEPAP